MACDTSRNVLNNNEQMAEKPQTVERSESRTDETGGARWPRINPCWPPEVSATRRTIEDNDTERDFRVHCMLQPASMASNHHIGFERPLAGIECLFDSLHPSLDPVTTVLRVSCDSGPHCHNVQRCLASALKTAAVGVQAKHPHTRASIEERRMPAGEGDGDSDARSRPWLVVREVDASRLQVVCWTAADVCQRLRCEACAGVGCSATTLVPLWQRAVAAVLGWGFDDQAAGYLFRVIVLADKPACDHHRRGTFTVFVCMPHSLCDAAGLQVLARDLLQGAVDGLAAGCSCTPDAAAKASAPATPTPLAPAPPLCPPPPPEHGGPSADAVREYPPAIASAIVADTSPSLSLPPLPAAAALRSVLDASVHSMFHSGSPAAFQRLRRRCKAEGSTIGGAVVAACAVAVLRAEFVARGRLRRGSVPDDATAPHGHAPESYVIADDAIVVADLRRRVRGVSCAAVSMAMLLVVCGSACELCYVCGCVCVVYVCV